MLEISRESSSYSESNKTSMDAFLEIVGGKRLSGEVQISGSKNAALPILAASLVAKGEHHFFNVPQIDDIDVMLEALRICGVTSKRDGSSLTLNSSGNITSKIPKDITSRFRGALYFLSSLLSRTGEVELGLPGGCNFGRPFDFHLSGLRELGAALSVTAEGIHGRVSRFKGADVCLSFPSLGTTCNLIIAACLAEGTTRLLNASLAPEVVDLCHYLTTMGAKIAGAGSGYVVIEGVNELLPHSHTVMPDRVEAATFLFAAVLTGGHITLLNCQMKLLSPLDTLLTQSGVSVTDSGNSIEVVANARKDFVKLDVTIGPDPALWTDWQPHVTVFAALCNGESTIKDMYYFGKRFCYVNELRQLGAEVEICDNVIRVRGPVTFVGGDVIATDIQGGISVVLAGLVAQGTTRVFHLDKIDRGYMGLATKLSQLGAEVVKKIKAPKVD